MTKLAAAMLLALFIIPSSLRAQDGQIDRLQREAAAMRDEVANLMRVDGAAAGADSDVIKPRLTNSAFHWTTDDGKFDFGMNTVVQFRFTYHDIRGDSGRGGDNGADFMNFNIPHMRITMQGNFFGREFQYKVQWRPVFRGSQVKLDDVWFRWAPSMLFNVTAGQMRIPATWETLIDPENWAIMDRSAADQAFNEDYGKGILFSSALDLWGVNVLTFNYGIFNGVSDGSGAQGGADLNIVGGHSAGVRVTDAEATENFNGGFRNRDGMVIGQTFGQRVDNDLMPAARIEFQPMGNVPRHSADTRTTRTVSSWLVMMGVSASWFAARTNGSGTLLHNLYRKPFVDATGVVQSTGSGRERFGFDTLTLSLDGHFRWMGLGVNWAVNYRRVEFHSFGSFADKGNIGPHTPAGVGDTGVTGEVNYYVLPRQVLIAFRVSAVNFDEFGSQTSGGQPVDGDSFGADSVEYTGSISYELQGDHLKIGLDYRYLIQQLPHGVGKGKGALDAVERISEYRNLSEIKIQLQWIF